MMTETATAVVRMPWDAQRKQRPCSLPGTTFGIAFGHGHVHRCDFMHQFPEVSNWYLVDADETTFPDFVCHVADQGMSYLPDSTWDTVVSVFCPIYESQPEFNAFLSNAKRILKPDGCLYLPNPIEFRFLAMFTKEGRSIIESDIFFFLGWENIQRFMEKREDYREDPFIHISIGNYARLGMPLGKEVNEWLSRIGTPMMKKLLNFNGFHYAGRRGDWSLLTVLQNSTIPSNVDIQ